MLFFRSYITLTRALVPTIDVNIEDSIPTTNVIAKPLTAPVPIVNYAIAAIRVVILASDIVEKAF